MQQESLKHYNCPQKVEARDASIISKYREVFGRYSIPTEKQYWTMCGPHSSIDKTLEINSELHQLLSTELLSSPSQFHGVDINPQTIEENRVAFPGANWYNEDLYQQMINSQNISNFNPAVVNCDFTRTVLTEREYFSKILFMLLEFKEVLVIGNFCRIHRAVNMSLEEVLNKLKKETLFKRAMQEKGGWEYDQVLDYPGAGRGSKVMTSFMFWR